MSKVKAKAADGRDVDSDDNAPKVVLPADKGEATKWIFQRLQRLNNEKRWLGDQARDLLKDFKAAGHSPNQARATLRLARMTPEKRQKWADDVNAAAAIFGYSPLGVADVAGKEVAPELWACAEKLSHMASEKKELTGEIREIYSVAADAGHDVAAYREILAWSRNDPAVIEDHIAELDALATFLLENDILTMDAG